MNIGVIGCGSMGQAIGQVLAKQHDLWFVDIHPLKAEELAKSVGGSTTVPEHSDFVILAIKPQEFDQFHLETIPRLLVSILTGIPLIAFKTKFPGIPILRMMPNLSIRYGKGVVALAEDSSVESLKEEIESVFNCFGLIKWLPESLFDAITSLTGSGPAFFYAIMEAMIEAGVRMGFTKQSSYDLVTQMILGSLETLKETHAYPAQLIPKITSPGGTTLAGLDIFKEKRGQEVIIAMFEAARNRAQEMAKQ